jgi:RHS repeat-associated protein
VIAVATPGKPSVVIDRIAYTPYGESTRTLRSDVNGNGVVNKDDYDGVIQPLKGTVIGDPAYVVEADLDRDGKITSDDYDVCIADDGQKSSGGVGEAGLFSAGVRNSVGYCGYIHNEDTGLYTVRYRTYSAVLGRWLKRDPAGYVDGMGLYQYVGSQPVTSLDPLGLDAGWARRPGNDPWGEKCSQPAPPPYRRQSDRWDPRKGCGVVVKRNIDAAATCGDAGKAALYVNAGHEWIEFWEYDGGDRWWVRGLGFWPQGWYRGCNPSCRPPQDQRKDASGPVPVLRENDKYTDTDGDRVVVWETTRTHLSGGGRELQFGFHKGKKCRDASCEAIVDCLRNFTPTAKWTEVTNDCRKGARDALSACCLTPLPNVRKSPTSSGSVPGKDSCGK